MDAFSLAALLILALGAGVFVFGLVYKRFEKRSS